MFNIDAGHGLSAFEVETQWYWRAVAEYRDALRAGDGKTARLALEELEGIGLHSESRSLRARCAAYIAHARAA